MGILWRSQDDRPASAEAMSRWDEAAATVGERFKDLHNLPLDEAVEVAALRAPGNFSREELRRRIAASRECNPQPGFGTSGDGA